MTRIAVLDDYHAYADMIAAPLKKGGHEVITEVAPIDWDPLLDFHPDLLVIGCYRRERAFNRSVENWEEDVLGMATIKEVEACPVVQLLPIVIIGSALVEKDVPTSVRYDAFLTFPTDINRLLPTVNELAANPNARRFISDYICPKPGCNSRLTYTKEPPRDLFCLTCHTSVAIIDEVNCIARGSNGEPLTCSMSQLLVKDKKTGKTHA